MSVTDWKELDNDMFLICSPEQISDKGHLFEINYNKKDLIIQTPRICLYSKPKEFTYNNRKYYQLNICFYNYKFNNEIKEFINKIELLETKIKEKSAILWKNLGYSNKNKTFVSSIGYNKDKSKAYLNLSIQMDNTKNESLCTVFDKFKNTQNLDYLIENSTGYCIILLRNIWRKGLKMGLNWVLLQIKVYQPITALKECLIDDPDENNPNNHYEIARFNTSSVPKPPINIPLPPIMPILTVNKEEHPIYGKYVKMKRMGIPDGAITSKCLMDNINYNDFLNFFNDTPSSSSSAPKPAFSLSNISAGLLQSVKLKKASENDAANKKIKINIDNPSGFKPPTSDDLMKIINKLKKITKDNE